MEKIKIWFLQQFRHFKLHPWPMWFLFDPHTFDIKGEDYYVIKDKIKKGDILLRSYKYYVDGYFIPGKYSHAAIYVGGQKETIIHAMTPDVQTTDLCTFMRCDNMAVIRLDLPERELEECVLRATSVLGRPYDYNFIFEESGDNVERKYSCSELVFYAFKKHKHIFDWQIREQKVLWVSKFLFTPDDCIPNNNRSRIVWEK